MIEYLIYFLALLLIIGSIFYLKKNPYFKEHQSFVEFVGIFFSLIFALVAINQTQKGIDNSTDDFNKLISRLDKIVTNVNNATELFNEQLESSRKLNDSLIHQISLLQKITNNQLTTTDKQLRVSIETYQELLYSNRPKMLVGTTVIEDTNNISEEIYKPIIRTKFENIGRRYAYKVNVRSFTLNPDFSNVQQGFRFDVDFMEPESKRVYSSYPEIPMIHKDNFFYCFEVSYYDTALTQMFNQAYYMNYRKSREKFNFYLCDNKTKQKLRSILNEKLRFITIERLFDEY